MGGQCLLGVRSIVGSALGVAGVHEVEGRGLVVLGVGGRLLYNRGRARPPVENAGGEERSAPGAVHGLRCW